MAVLQECEHFILRYGTDRQTAVYSTALSEECAKKYKSRS